MNAGHLKGALLEFIVRQLLHNCGFTNVRADNLYTYENNGLFYINGQGSAHDADIIVNPPIQMPFTYPTQLVFECKAYEKTTPLTFVRNVLGLRNDLNSFEIVTEDTLRRRQSRGQYASYSIQPRTRYWFQVGLASIKDFSPAAYEFAAVNKIPLISLAWLLDAPTLIKFTHINKQLLDQMGSENTAALYQFFKDRDGNIDDVRHQKAKSMLQAVNPISEIVSFAKLVIKHSYVGLLETGDMVFLFAHQSYQDNIIGSLSSFKTLNASIHWDSGNHNRWRLTIYDRTRSLQESDFSFYLPRKIFQHWKQFNFDRGEALNIKGEFFSKIFVFNGMNSEMPFTIINIDRQWLDEARRNLEESNRN